MPFFYDTCSLLNRHEKIFKSNESFYISSITLKELEDIKDSRTKDIEIKYETRKVLNLLKENQNLVHIVFYNKVWDKIFSERTDLPDTNDSRILLCAIHSPCIVTFVTDDIACQIIAKTFFNLNIQDNFSQQIQQSYKGYKTIIAKNDDELNMIYKAIYQSNIDFIPLVENEYLLIKDKENKIIDKYKKKDSHFERLINYPIFYSSLYGKVKPKDDYQFLAMDSLLNNKLTMIRGAAGTGKSYIAIAFLLSQLEAGKIDRILVFCNPVATRGAAKLGFYPGDRNTKLLDSQIGNFLVSKLGGDKGEVISRYIDSGLITLLPMSDIRGYDTTGLHAGIYITEAQNMDIELMKLALQRVGEDSICILDGDDETQVDLNTYAGKNNGMKRVSQIFRGKKIYGEVTLPCIYRSKIAEIAQKM